MHRLHRNFIRLFTLAEAYQVRKEQELSLSLVIADPYYLYESYLVNYENKLNAMYYIENLFFVNKDKEMFVLPYFSE
jgi:flagellar assembly factor FliW